MEEHRADALRLRPPVCSQFKEVPLTVTPFDKTPVGGVPLPLLTAEKPFRLDWQGTHSPAGRESRKGSPQTFAGAAAVYL